jgi:hypothetical protein
MKSNTALITSTIVVAAMILKAQADKKLTASQKQNRTIQFLRATK